ncbi:ectoine/hydroxyectoine ABC transporter permease subunit EhuC [Phaeovulum sp. NW3]|uniref:ectoine/hydroxyectoine ABC transporter permease subunit EhuC n=1 Tax=Phaeovulum sp. NW3 TaxID=2934933 RepID=UPI002020A21B|nr:ectoine/hydroxyectoine ABC transporter permease subunit EhuC [Phaeovulum sp. NW3]
MSYSDFLVIHGPRLLGGTWITVQQTVLAAVLAVLIALLFGLLKISPLRPVRALASVYIEVFRGTSLLVQLYWIFFVLPLFGITIDKFTAGFVAVGLNLGAYGAEVVRGAIQSVPRGQWEAALALNLSPARRMWRIILPQALVNMLPAWGNLMIEVLKGTALVAMISVADLMFEARQINGSTYLSAQVFGTALVIYYLLGRLGVTPLMRWLEKTVARRMGRV